MPWKVLGRKWHLSRKGFPPGKKVAWPQETLEELLELLESTREPKRAGASPPPDGATRTSAPQFLWNNQQVIHLMVPGQRVPWATVQTKRTVGVDLSLHGPAGAFATGRIADLGVKRLVQSGEQRLRPGEAPLREPRRPDPRRPGGVPRRTPRRRPTKRPRSCGELISFHHLAPGQ